MSNVDDREEPQQASPPQRESHKPSMSPGKMLKAAREALFRTQAEIAEQLRLSVEIIKDIERDDYTKTPALIYTRGYLRAYARAVKIAEDEVLAAFDTLGVHEPEIPNERKVTVNAQTIPVFTQSEGRGSRSLRWITVIVGVALVAFVVMWWRDQTNNQFSPTLQSAISKKHKPQKNAPVPNTTTDNAIPAPSATNLKSTSVTDASSRRRGVSDLNAPLRPEAKTKQTDKSKKKRRRSESWTEVILPMPIQSASTAHAKSAKPKEKVKAGSNHG